jgi:hypothetical protein
MSGLFDQQRTNPIKTLSQAQRTSKGLVVPGRWSMGKANRLVGYLASVTCASLFYMLWFLFVVQNITPTPNGSVALHFKIGFALFFWLFGGMGAAFVLMAFPWYLAVVCHERLRRFGLIYFSLVGAAITIAIGCGTSSLAPKPLFIEDQTFLEGFMIAVQRQGVCLLLTGFVFGLTFWLVSERLRQPGYMNAS